MGLCDDNRIVVGTVLNGNHPYAGLRDVIPVGKNRGLRDWLRAERANGPTGSDQPPVALCETLL